MSPMSLSPQTLDVLVEFESFSHSLSEGSSLAICLTLSGRTELNVSVIFEVEDETASEYIYETSKIVQVVCWFTNSVRCIIVCNHGV